MPNYFVRKVAMNGTSLCVALPREIRAMMGVALGDFIALTHRADGVVEIIKWNGVQVPDRVSEAAQPLPEIHV